VAAVWPAPAPDRVVAADQAAEPASAVTTEFLDTTMAMLGGRPGADKTWTRSH
jgi:hypothetical protein